MKKTILFLILISLLTVSVVIAGDCVPEKEVINSWERYFLIEGDPNGGFVISVNAVCTPCSCNNSMASCYEYLAEQERFKIQEYSDALALIERAKKYGICK
jgi:hypothetical protein